MQDLLTRLQIQDNDWDYLLVTDGSATTWQADCGFAGILIERGSLKIQICDGAFHRGTNNVAECMAVLYPLLYLLDGCQRRRRPNGQSHVHVVTDSEYVRRHGEGEQPGRSHRLLWSQLAFLRSAGLKVKFHWIGREESSIQRLAHHAANAMRTQMRDSYVARRKQTLSALKIAHPAVLVDPDASVRVQ